MLSITRTAAAPPHHHSHLNDGPTAMLPPVSGPIAPLIALFINLESLATVSDYVYCSGAAEKLQ